MSQGLIARQGPNRQLGVDFSAPAAGQSDLPVAEKTVIAVHIKTGERMEVSARYVDERRTQDRENGVSKSERWHRQHKFVCPCCGDGVQYSHVKSATHRHKNHEGVKQASTHWRLFDGHRHKRGCLEHKKDLQSLLVSGTKDADYVLELGFTPRFKNRQAGVGKLTPSFPALSVVSSHVPSRTGKSSADKITISDLRELEDTIDFLRGALSEERFNRVVLNIPGIGKVSARESVFDSHEGQDFIDALSEGARGPLFLGVVLNLQYVCRNDGDFQMSCHGMPVDYLGTKLIVRPVISVAGKKISEDAFAGHFSQGHALRIMMSPDECSDLALKMRRAACEPDHDGVIDFKVSVKTLNNVPNIGRAQDAYGLDHSLHFRPEWFRE